MTSRFKIEEGMSFSLYLYILDKYHYNKSCLFKFRNNIKHVGETACYQDENVLLYLLVENDASLVLGFNQLWFTEILLLRYFMSIILTFISCVFVLYMCEYIITGCCYTL